VNSGELHHLDLTLPTPAENLACDEALLDAAESGSGPGVLRFWESPHHFAVLGYAGRTNDEANMPACEAASVPILRRCSGGGTVLQGPGCLSYSLVLPIDPAGKTATITGTNCFVMERNARVLSALLGTPVRVEGHTDLAVNGLKFSGNAQRRRQHTLLFHGTFLLDFDLTLIERCLRPPPRQPAYRRNRPHSEFLMKLPLGREAIKRALRETWNARPGPAKPPSDRIESLARARYSRPDWNLRW
jgi:lipoate-protein ligase A